MTDNRGVASTLSYILTLSITTILLVGLFAGAGSLVETQHDRAVKAELTVQGERLAADLMTVDRLSRTTTEHVEVRSELPTQVGGEGYRIEIKLGEERIELLGRNVDASVRLKIENDVDTEPLTGGAIVIAFDGERIEVGDG